MNIAIYDLDRTLTRQPTFTPFLVFAARRIAAVRLALVPVWIVMMIGYRLKLYNRTRLKEMGMALMLGRVSRDRLEVLGTEFARRRIENDGIMPGARELLEQDRAKGARLVMATAAFEFYATAFAQALGFDACIATRWDGKNIPGGNCYGETKKQRVLAWLDSQNIDASKAHIRFVSDSFADSPLLDLVQNPIFVTENAAQKRRAEAQGWQVMDLSSHIQPSG
ncbi:MAG: HAD family hydrolase [Sphingomonadaceae bacterium]